MPAKQKTTRVWLMRSMGLVYMFPENHKPQKPTMEKPSWSNRAYKTLRKNDRSQVLFSFCQRKFAKFCPVHLPLDTPVRATVRLFVTLPTT